MKKSIEEALVDGIRKTINRFRERPLNYFTESDIHSSLMKDIMEGNSNLFLHLDVKSNVEISLIHNEYPTNFRYEKAKLKDGYRNIDIGASKDRENTWIHSEIGDRGNYDLSILNKEFVKKELNNPREWIEKNTKYNPVTELSEAIKHIINKEIDYPKTRSKANGDLSDGLFYAKGLETELDYAIEVKFIHPFNARNKDMLYEVIRDNTKLNLAKAHTDGFTKTINLIFCSSEEKTRNNKTDPVISKIRDYIKNGTVEDYDNKVYTVPDGVINIFIESYLSGDIKNTPKPIVYLSGKGNSLGLYKDLKTAFKIT